MKEFLEKMKNQKNVFIYNFQQLFPIPLTPLLHKTKQSGTGRGQLLLLKLLCLMQVTIQLHFFSYEIVADGEYHHVEILAVKKNFTLKVDGGLARSIINEGKNEYLGWNIDRTV